MLGLMAVLTFASLMGASLACADIAPVLAVTDEGPGVVNNVGVAASLGGTCAHLYEAQQANGVSPCPETSWPGPAGQWSPTLTISGGDVLRLTFASPVNNVSFASTTNYSLGLTTPEGMPVPNSNVVPPTSATPTASPEVWTASIPNPLSSLASSPVTFAVVAQDAVEDHDYVLSIQEPHCVSQNEPLTPGTFPCPLAPGYTSGGSQEPKNTSPVNSPQKSSTVNGPMSKLRPAVHIVSVKQQPNHRYLVTVIASSAGKLTLAWYQGRHLIARFGTRLMAKRTVFDVKIIVRQHTRLRVRATFRNQVGEVARQVTVFTAL